MLRGATAVFRRELAGYFSTPVAYVFIVIFLILAGVFTFQIGGLYERGQADLQPFFAFHPWLYLFLVPALAMRLWAEEHKSGTIELLMTLPLSRAGAIMGKFMAAWAFAGAALALTFPVWVTVNFLGSPDNGAILAGYVGSFLMAGAVLALGSCASAGTKSQVIAFIITAVLVLGFLLAGFSPVVDFFRGWAPPSVVDTIASFSFLTRFEGMSKGVIDARDVAFFATLMGVCLAMNAIILEAKRA